MPKQSTPAMHDPEDHEIHSAKGEAPYPTPAKSKVETNAADDTVDPATEDPDAPHDRGVERDGHYETGVEAMRKDVKEDGERDAWRDGRTQNKR